MAHVRSLRDMDVRSERGSGLGEPVLLGQVRSACGESICLHGGFVSLCFYLFETGSHCKIKLTNVIQFCNCSFQARYKLRMQN